MQRARPPVLLCAAAMILAGCWDGSPTEATNPPEELTAGTPASRYVLVVTAAELQTIGAAVDDMRSRVLPTLAEAPESAGVADVLDRLSAALERRDADVLMQAAAEIGEIRASLDLDSEWAAEFDILSLLVDVAQRHIVIETVERSGRTAVGGDR
jgi:hypothetical protein